jgi:predicted small lipoprotein YifL
MTGAGKKRLAAVLAAVILAGALSGCGGKLPEEVAADDILTMTPVDSKR